RLVRPSMAAEPAAARSSLMPASVRTIFLKLIASADRPSPVAAKATAGHPAGSASAAGSAMPVSRKPEIAATGPADEFGTATLGHSATPTSVAAANAAAGQQAASAVDAAIAWTAANPTPVIQARPAASRQVRDSTW